ncbi:cyclic nucleotide-binding domain-containing protein [bacterium]|nr:cyclic nucleotide-binding domain-containing protein [bacterium]
MRKVLFILGELTEQDLDWLVTRGSPQTAVRGRAIIVQGQPIDSMFIILDGSFAVVAGAHEDKPLAVVGSGEIVGEMSLVDQGPPSATVRAREDSRVLAIARADLEEKLRTDIGFNARFHRALALFLADRLRNTFRTMGQGSAFSLREDVLEDHEVDPAVLDKVAIAGLRFETMLRRLIPD